MKSLSVLIIGSGGRESAFFESIQASQCFEKIFSWPKVLRVGGRETLLLGTSHLTLEELASVTRDEGVNVVLVGPEAYIEAGITEEFSRRGIACFGPSREAGLLETSKAFAKSVMERARIPTAHYRVVHGQVECREVAKTMLKEEGACVLKASGLAAGKGVVVCDSVDDLEKGIDYIYSNHKDAAKELVVESKLIGRECSYFCAVGPFGVFDLGFAVDYKRRYDGHLGPNTGGMGCYSPVEWLPRDATEKVHQQVVIPLLAEMKSRGTPYTGFLYVGLMWHPIVGPQVVEFNVRMGDPETQVVAQLKSDILKMYFYPTLLHKWKSP